MKNTKSTYNTFNPICVNSKVSICGAPVRVDTYNRCSFGCTYCFAEKRTIMPKNTDFKIADLDKVRELLKRVEEGRYTEKDFLETLAASGITWHCGGMSDPFQPIERELGITKELVDISNEHGVHILFSTKSDTVYDADIKPENASFQLSVTNLDDRRDIEPNVPDISRRIQFYHDLKKEGFKVGIRIQPFIPGVTSLDIVKEFADADNFTIEGLKLVPQNREYCEQMCQKFGLKLSDFKMMGLYNLKPEIRNGLYKPFVEYFKEHNIPYSIADNDMHNRGTNLCCCGDSLVKNPTTFNNTYLSHKYSRPWTLDEMLEEVDKCKCCECDCRGLYASNRINGCKTLKDFCEYRFNRTGSTYGPNLIYDFN